MIQRAPRKNRFVQIPNATARDPRLSFKARGLLAYMLSMPDDWQGSSEEIASTGPDGRDAVRSALSELEAAGYLVRERKRRPDGTFYAVAMVHDEPQTAAGEPVPGLTCGNDANAQVAPGTGNPTPVRPAIEEEDHSYEYLEDQLPGEASSMLPAVRAEVIPTIPFDPKRTSAIREYETLPLESWSAHHFVAYWVDQHRVVVGVKPTARRIGQMAGAIREQREAGAQPDVLRAALLVAIQNNASPSNLDYLVGDLARRQQNVVGIDTRVAKVKPVDDKKAQAVARIRAERERWGGGGV